MRKATWFLWLVFSAPAWAAFQTDLSGARSSSLGGAVAASGEGAADFFRTPAALARASSMEASLMYSRPFSGIEGEDFGVGQAALAVPTFWGTWGAGAATFRARGAMEETTLSFGAAVSMAGGRVRAGAALKRLSHQYLIDGDAAAQNDPVFRGGASRSAFDADLGLTASPGGPFELGVSVRNVRRADVGLAGRDRLRREVQSGVVVNLRSLDMTAAGDLGYDSRADGSARRVLPSVGLEKTFRAGFPFFLRTGVNRDRFSAGLGLAPGRLKLDYAFLMPRVASAVDVSTHQIHLTWRFSAAGGR
jgi:hypothetical protein